MSVGLRLAFFIEEVRDAGSYGRDGKYEVDATGLLGGGRAVDL
jgi:hypothetical protein